MQPTELVGRTIDRDCFDVMPGTNRGKLDGTIQITPVEQLEPVRASNSQLNCSNTLIFHTWSRNCTNPSATSLGILRRK
jgi:hypothetical protein